MNNLWLKIVDQLHVIYSLYGTIRYGLWYRNICLVGITGTDGKSSTVVLTTRLLRKAGVKTAHYSSININDGESEVLNINKMTTPGRAELHKFLATAARKKATHAVIELTSEGIKQWRHLGIKFDILVYTNITKEHIERHGSFEKYKTAKLSLLRSLKESSDLNVQGKGIVIWNGVDEELNKMSEIFAEYPNYRFNPPQHTCNPNPFLDINYQLAKVITSQLALEADLSNEEKILPGRFEYYENIPSIIIDYAHTPYAVNMCLQAARKLCRGKLIHVFGAAGGGRDTWKRPLLAEISEKYADVHILTEENSFDEPTDEILAEVKTGFSNKAKVYIELVREEAVRKAFSIALPNDLIICTAKGSEVVISGPKKKKRPYNEREFVKQCLNLKQS